MYRVFSISNKLADCETPEIRVRGLLSCVPVVALRGMTGRRPGWDVCQPNGRFSACQL